MGGGPAPRAGWLAICEAGDPEAARRAVRAGAAGVVTRPFKPTSVAAQVRMLLELPAGRRAEGAGGE
jgi:AmiR/NasT family two-component response regulator